MTTEPERAPLSTEVPGAVSGPSQAVFLSYASEDAPASQRIAEALRAAGVELWFDKSELRGGDAWDRQIRKQIHDCALFIPIISAHSQARLEGYFRREWKLAADRTHDMAEEKAFLVPVVIDDTSERVASVPEKFRDVQWTHLPAGETPAAFIERVKRLLSLATACELAPGAQQSTRRLRCRQGLVARKLIPTVPNAPALDACGAPSKTFAFQVISNSLKPAATTVDWSSASSRAPAIHPVQRSTFFFAPSGTSRLTRISPI
jgi:TIR domain-containing protein